MQRSVNIMLKLLWGEHCRGFPAAIKLTKDDVSRILKWKAPKHT